MFATMASTILWVYIVLLVIGGLIGFLKAGSKPSLIASVVFAALLSLCAAGVVHKMLIDISLIVLLIVFGMRLAKTRKFMPAGMMLIVTVAVLALRHVL